MTSAPTLGTPKFPRDTAGFHSELKRRVAHYFVSTGKRERDTASMYLKTLVIFALWIASYIALVFLANTWWMGLLAGFSVAIAMTAVGFAIQHDGGHGGYSRFGWVNRLAAMTLDLIGASSYLWRWKHGVLHHTYPNVDGYDTDLESNGVARLTPQQPRKWFHRWQHFYLWPLYGLTASRWHLMGDFRDVMASKIGEHPIDRPKGLDLAVFILGKVISIGLMLVLPMFWHPWWLVLGFYVYVTAVIGVVLTVVFQLAHCVGEADFPAPQDDTLRMESAWAVHQVETTVDFARENRLWAWYLGGLNFQIEHHLFPKICHTHYPALSKIVEQVCQEYGVRYGVHRTFFDGVKAHYRHLREMGKPPRQRKTSAALSGGIAGRVIRTE
jgi:linoleoyl-CoA desaturase